MKIPGVKRGRRIIYIVVMPNVVMMNDKWRNTPAFLPRRY